MSKQILIFGDSIAYGAWDEKGGWVERLRVYTNIKTIKSDLEYYCAVYNLAIDGDTTEKLLNRVDFEIKERASENEVVIIFALGSNDSEIINSDKTFRISKEKFKINIEELISISKKYAAKIVFIGMLPVDESKVDPIPWARNRSYKNDSLKKYNEIIQDICKENKISFIELYEKFKKMDYKKLLADGVHPNSKGHEKIYEIVSAFLREEKII